MVRFLTRKTGHPQRKALNHRIVAGLDIGTCFIRTVIAEVDSDDKIEIIGVSKVPSQGVRNGVIVNVEAAMNSIRESIEAAEQQAGVLVTYVFTDIGGSQVETMNSTGTAIVDTRGRNQPMEIGVDAKMRAIESAKAVLIPFDKIRLTVIPQEFYVDDTLYPDPIGIKGVRLDVKTHLVSASRTALENIRQCILRAEYNVDLDHTCLKTLAISRACAYDDEIDLGSIIIDLGGGTTDVMVLNKGAPVFTTSIPAGGNRVTNDIAQVMGVPFAVAEKLKLDYGTAWLFGGEDREEVIIPGIGNLPPEQSNREVLSEIIQARLEEILNMAREAVIKGSNLKHLNGSIILTGGGALMNGIVELTQNVWKTTAVRLGQASELGEVDLPYRSPEFATCVGIVLVNKKVNPNGTSGTRATSGVSEGAMGKLKKILKKFC